MREGSKTIKVFICGSISIKGIPPEAQRKIDKIIDKKYEILVGDASGVDVVIQQHCADKKYFNLTIYTIKDKPRNIVSNNFKIRIIKKDTNEIEYVPIEKENNNKKKQSERDEQWLKDKAMIDDCDYGLIVWDGESRGSYKNLFYMIELQKKFRLYIDNKEVKNKTKKYLEKIFRENYGFNKKELCEELKKKDLYISVKELNNLLEKYHIKGDIEKFNKRYNNHNIRFSTKILEEIIDKLNNIKQPTLEGFAE